jgi:hypothetical protein
MKKATNTFVYFNHRNFYEENAMPWLRQLVSGLSLHRYGFNPKAPLVVFVMDRVLPKYFSFPVRTILVSIHTHTPLHSPTISSLQP